MSTTACSDYQVTTAARLCAELLGYSTKAIGCVFLQVEEEAKRWFGYTAMVFYSLGTVPLPYGTFAHNLPAAGPTEIIAKRVELCP